MVLLICPACLLRLPPGATNCTRCGMRIATLPRHRITDAPEDLADVTAWRWRRVAIDAGLGAGALVLLSVVAAAVWAAMHGGFAEALANSAIASGAVCLCLTLLLGDRYARWHSSIPLSQKPGGAGGSAPLDERLALGIAGGLVVGLAVLLTVLRG